MCILTQLVQVELILSVSSFFYVKTSESFLHLTYYLLYFWCNDEKENQSVDIILIEEEKNAGSLMSFLRSKL